MEVFSYSSLNSRCHYGKRVIPIFIPELRLEGIQLVAEKRYLVVEVAKTVNVGKSSLDKWDRQLKMSFIAAQVKQPR